MKLHAHQPYLLTTQLDFVLKSALRILIFMAIMEFATSRALSLHISHRMKLDYVLISALKAVSLIKVKEDAWMCVRELCMLGMTLTP